MAVKSQIDVDVNDEAFKKFLESFKKYQDAIDATNDNLEVQEKTTVRMRKNFSAMVKDLLRGNEDTKRKSKDAAKSWESIADSARKFADRVADAGRTILKWGGLSGLLGGLLGVGGFFGLDKLAGVVGAGRRSSLGLGLSYGEQKAFDTFFSRIVDTSSLLGGVSEALADPALRGKLYGVGVRDTEGKDTAEISLEILKNFQAMVQRTPQALWASNIKAFGYDQFGLDVQAARRASVLGPEFLTYFSQYQKNKGAFDLAPDVQKKWQDLDVQLTAAGKKIETVLIRGLAPLATPLDRLSSSVANAVTTFLEAASKQHWLEQLGGNIEWLARTLGDPKTQKAIADGVQGVGDFGRTVFAISKKLGWLFGIPQSAEDKSRGDAGRKAGFWAEVASSVGIGGYDGKRDAVLDAIRYSGERSGRWSTSPKGAKGVFQLMPNIAKHFGVDPTDNDAARGAAGKLLDELARAYHGDLAKIIAGYNWGQTKLDRDIAQHGKAWAKFLPDETAKYLARVLGALATKGVTKIEIDNNTGGIANVNVKQVAGQ